MSLAPPTAPARPGRLAAVDALRGAVMIVMALDHVRDFVHAGAMTFNPVDLSKTTPAIFVTRWITHICAPAFMLLAGIGACLLLQRDGSKVRVSRFLWTRGLWLIVLELTVMRLAMNFTLDWQYPVIVLVLCALGVSMIALAALIHLPVRAIAVISGVILVFHNTLDGVMAQRFGAFAPLWHLAHQVGFFLVGDVPVVIAYPVLPWIGIMAAGFCLGHVFRLERPRRRRLLVSAGTALIVLFAIIRWINVYGDPAPWSPQPSTLFTLLSFLNTTKYPPSLSFALMTLGPALLTLAYFDARPLRVDHPVVVIGRVPLFYYVVHFWLIHVVASALAFARYGTSSFTFFFMPLPSMGGSAKMFPPEFGYPLWVAYVVWVGVVLAMYPLCRWFDRVKRTSGAWWASYC
jgi:uncharacterized membrane protein